MIAKFAEERKVFEGGFLWRSGRFSRRAREARRRHSPAKAMESPPQAGSAVLAGFR